MKTWIKAASLSVALVLGTPLAMAADAPSYTAGKEYTVIQGNNVGPQPELREYFSLFCPHCAGMEQYVELIKEQLPEDVGFNRTHVDFLGGLSPALQKRMTQAYVFAQQSGDGDKFVHFMFKRIHSENNRPKSEADVDAAMVDFGYSEPAVAMGMASNSVVQESDAMALEQALLVEQGVLKGVPSFIVNNKYLINMNQLDRKDPLGDLAKLVQHLNSL
ncbi:MAG: thiol:disulfide interchange protein DsbA/DsbL [Planctomycetes bacterium]|nr:thiol:disulfide interchange protein DsbA/DsbL [Planctomycetota bacterium]|tara:strand:+ start:2005 stop:2658 length:654 start_codon:yes stop_codon:yes gene_type:complete